MTMRRGTPLAAALAVALALAANGAPATESPRPAKDLLAEATASAASGKKTVFVGFHATWCGWCRKLERVLGSPGVKEAFGARFETVWLTVQERGAKKPLNTPGGQELYRQWARHDDVGLPFYAFLDGTGKVLASSVTGPDGKAAENLGYPGDAPELERFLGLVKKAAPAITPEELSALRAGFAPKAP
jgi:thiol-disulfide isomerase/thioredoxin